ncbi:MAG: amidohydrolase [Tissierellia bacterium]|nr:amidohydrolase [Tissierellia bacterium]
MKTYVNGKIYVDKDRFVEAFAVEGDRIVAIGSQEDIGALGGQDQVDLKGRTVLPGLIDAHLHLRTLGETRVQLRLYEAKSIQDVIHRGRAYLEDHPGIPLMVGRGWNQDYFVEGDRRFLNRHDLDQISTDIPIIAERVCVHVVSCNTKALDLLGLDRDLTLEGGEIHRDPEGNPLGIFSEKATGLVWSLLPEDGKKDIQEKFMAGVHHALACGLTSVQSCDLYMMEDWAPTQEAIEELYLEGRSPLRYYPQVNMTSLEAFRDYVDRIYKREGVYNLTYQRGGLKLFKDGSLGARTALLSRPYQDDPTTQGLEALSNAYVDAVCRLADNEGIQLVTHCIGDEAIRRVLDSYEKVNHKNPHRNGLVHMQITDRPLLERAAQLNINVIYQPIFLEYDITMLKDRVGEDLAASSYAHKTLGLDLGAHTAYSTDAPVEDLNPFPCIYSAVTRQRFNGQPKGGFYPQERVPLAHAIDCYSLEGAYMEGNEGIKGRIKPGYLADFIILDRDIFTLEESEIKEVQVERTFIGGQEVYRRD